MVHWTVVLSPCKKEKFQPVSTTAPVLLCDPSDNNNKCSRLKSHHLIPLSTSDLGHPLKQNVAISSVTDHHRKEKLYVERESVRKWFVLAASFFIHIIIWGAAWGAGVFQVIFMEEFGGKGDAAKVSIIPTLIPAFMSFVGPIASALTNRFGCRSITILGSVVMTAGMLTSSFATSILFLYFTFSLIGIGCGLTFIPIVVIVCQYFEEKRAIAIATASSGVGVGVFLYPPTIQLLSHHFHWRGALQIMSAVCLNIIVAALIFETIPDSARPKPIATNTSDQKKASEEKQKTKPKRKVLRVKMMRDPAFVCFVVNNILLLYAIVSFYIHMPAHAISIGFSADEGAMLPSVAGASTLVSRLLVGVVVQKFNAPISLYILSMCMAGCAIILVPFLVSQWSLMIVCVVFGAGSATLGPLIPLISSQLVGPSAIGDAYGYIMVAEGLGSLIGPPLSGLLYDASSNYTLSLNVAGLAMILGSLLMGIPLWKVWRKNRRHLTDLLLTNIDGEEYIGVTTKPSSVSLRPLLVSSGSMTSTASSQQAWSSQIEDEVYQPTVYQPIDRS